MRATTLLVNQNMAAEQNEVIKETVEKESKRLLSFIKKRVPDSIDAEDILQDVFYQFVESYRMMQPIEKVTSWLFTVARNKITDMFRKQKPESLENQNFKQELNDEGAETFDLGDILPDSADGPEAIYFRSIIMDELENALDELPQEQRDVFVMHEIEDKSFKEISELTGETVNTLLSRKRYAILYLRERLQQLYNEL